MSEKNIRQLGTLSPQEKRALLAQLYSNEVQKPRTAPMSFAQERVWNLCQFEPDDPAFNITMAYCLVGPLDVAVLEQGFNQVVRRQAVLRTAFATVDGQPAQIVAPKLDLQLALRDLSEIPRVERAARVQQMVIQENRQLFDLAHRPLLRVTLLRLSEQEHVLLLTAHRMIFDGGCWRVLILELIASIEALSTGNPLSLSELPLQYADFATWQRRQLADEVQQAQLAYWQEKLAGKIRLLQLPTDYPRSAAQSRSEIQTFTLSQALSDMLRAFSRQEGVSLFVTLLAGLQALLYRYTSQEDFLVFSSVAGRDRPELERLIGLFANILALRADLAGEPSFRELIGRARETVADAYAHQDLPFERISEILRVERESYTPVLQVMFVFWPEPLPPIEWPGITLSPLDVDTKPAEFDLHLHITNTHPEISGALRYKADLFEATSITKLLEDFQGLVTNILAAPEQSISALFPRAQAEQRSVVGSVPILPGQWLFLPPPDLWVNVVGVVGLHQTVNPALLERAVGCMLEHHDALRVHFVHEGARWQQFISPPDGNTPFTYVDLSELPLAKRETEFKAGLAAVQSSLGPLKDSLVHVGLFDLGVQRPEYLALTVHHVAADNASLSILMNDLCTVYQQLDHGEPMRLPPKTTSVKAWAEQLDAILQSAEFHRLLDSELALFPEKDASLPTDYPEGRSRNTVASTSSVQVSLSVEETNALLIEFPRVHKVWLVDALLTALVQAVTQWSGKPYLMIQTVDSGRDVELLGAKEVDLSRTVGCLLLPGILVLERATAGNPAEALQWIKKQRSRFMARGISIGIASQVEYRQKVIPKAQSVGLRLNYLGQATLLAPDGWAPQIATALEDFVADRRNRDINRNPILLNCTAAIIGGKLVVGWEYSENIHARETIARVANNFVETLKAMIDYTQGVMGTREPPVMEKAFVAPRSPTEKILSEIWSMALGLDQIGVDSDFFELGGDSLAATRVISRVRSDFRVDLPFHLLFEVPTVASMANYIDEVCKAEHG